MSITREFIFDTRANSWLISHWIRSGKVLEMVSKFLADGDVLTIDGVCQAPLAFALFGPAAAGYAGERSSEGSTWT
jgi:hypothetical protein